MKNELNNKEIALLEKVKSEWINRFNSLYEIDEKQAISDWEWLYSICGLKKPKVLFFDSPMGCQIAINKLQKNNKKNLTHFTQGIYGDIGDMGWTSFYDYFTRIGIINDKTFNRYKKMIWNAPFCTIQTESIVFLSRLPNWLQRDTRGRLHCPTDYAICFRDGYGIHYLHGVFISPEIFEKVKNETITFEEIMKLENTEQRMAIFQTLGFDNFLSKLDYKVIDRKKQGYSPYIKEDIYCEVIEFRIDDISVRGFKFKDFSTGKQGVELLEIGNKGWSINTCDEALKFRYDVVGEYDILQNT